MDGVIDHLELLEGLDRMGLSFTADSLNLDSEQEVLRHHPNEAVLHACYAQPCSAACPDGWEHAVVRGSSLGPVLHFIP